MGVGALAKSGRKIMMPVTEAVWGQGATASVLACSMQHAMRACRCMYIVTHTLASTALTETCQVAHPRQ